jgi:hypothetical protein
VKQQYEVANGLDWLLCKIAEEQPSGWLHYELRDGTIGLARPGRWRKAEQLTLPELRTKARLEGKEA